MDKEMHPEEGLNIGENSIIVSRDRKAIEIWELGDEEEYPHKLLHSEKINPDMRAIEGVENALKTLISMMSIAEAWNED